MVVATTGKWRVSFDGSIVVISKDPGWTMGKMVNRPEVRIPLGTIDQVEYEAAGMATPGWLRFLTGGGRARGGLKHQRFEQIKGDPQAITFKRKQEADFIKVRDAIEQALAHR